LAVKITPKVLITTGRFGLILLKNSWKEDLQGGLADLAAENLCGSLHFWA